MRFTHAYRVRVRNTSAAGGGTWATYIRSIREAAGFTKAAFARRLGVDRATVFRWEGGTSHPDSPAIVVTIADMFGLDLDEALVAAGLRPSATAPPERPTQQRDPVIQWILDNPMFDEDEKLALVKRELARIERERAERIAELEWMTRERGRRDPA